MIKQPARIVPSAVITATCCDCGAEFTGPIALRFIETREGPGVEILVIKNEMEEWHCVARVPKSVVPTVIFRDLGRPV